MLRPEIGPDGLARESPVIAYTEKVPSLSLSRLGFMFGSSLTLTFVADNRGRAAPSTEVRYIEENYSQIRDVERELANLRFELKLTAGPKKAALEHMRKKIEMSTERIYLAKIKEEQAWEEASEVIKEEEAVKQKLCEDLNQLVQESSNSQHARLEELKRRLKALNLSRASTASPHDGQLVAPSNNRTVEDASAIPLSTPPSGGAAVNIANQANGRKNGQPEMGSDGEEKPIKKIQFHGRVRGVGAVPKGRVPSGPGWTRSGFDVDGRS